MKKIHRFSNPRTAQLSFQITAIRDTKANKTLGGDIRWANIRTFFNYLYFFPTSHTFLRLSQSI